MFRKLDFKARRREEEEAYKDTRKLKKVMVFSISNVSRPLVFTDVSACQLEASWLLKPCQQFC